MNHPILVLGVILILLILLCTKMRTEAYTVFEQGAFNLDQNVWGPNLWNYIHSMAYGYPDNPTKEVKLQAKNFIYSLPSILPCKDCQKHFKKNLNNLPPKLDSKMDFFNWSIDIHNLVNLQLGKPQRDRNDILNIYREMYASSKSSHRIVYSD